MLLQRIRIGLFYSDILSNLIIIIIMIIIVIIIIILVVISPLNPPAQKSASPLPFPHRRQTKKGKEKSERYLVQEPSQDLASRQLPHFMRISFAKLERSRRQVRHVATDELLRHHVFGPDLFVQVTTEGADARAQQGGVEGDVNAGEGDGGVGAEDSNRVGEGVGGLDEGVDCCGHGRRRWVGGVRAGGGVEDCEGGRGAGDVG